MKFVQMLFNKNLKVSCLTVYGEKRELNLITKKESILKACLKRERYIKDLLIKKAN